MPHARLDPITFNNQAFQYLQTPKPPGFSLLKGWIAAVTGDTHSLFLHYHHPNGKRRGIYTVTLVGNGTGYTVETKFTAPQRAFEEFYFQKSTGHKKGLANQPFHFFHSHTGLPLPFAPEPSTALHHATTTHFLKKENTQ